jgi:hypothetical protein
MPVGALPGLEADRAPFTHLEAVGRTLAGIAPSDLFWTNPTLNRGPRLVRADLPADISVP